MDILIIIFSIDEHRISLHLFVSSSVSFINLFYFSQYSTISFILNFILFLIGGQLLYNSVVISAIYQHKSAIGPFLLKPPSLSQPSTLSQSTSFGFPASYSKFPLPIYLIYSNRYVSVLLSQIIPLSVSPTVSKSLFFMFVSLLLFCR